MTPAKLDNNPGCGFAERESALHLQGGSCLARAASRLSTPSRVRLRQGEHGAADRRLVRDFPAAVFHDPVLTLAGLLREVVRAVVLVERDRDQVLLPRGAEHTHVSQANLDPGFCGVDPAFMFAPSGDIHSVRTKVPCIVRKIAAGVAALPGRAP